MKLFALTLCILLAAIQYPLWLGKGGWLKVAELDRLLVKQEAANAVQIAKNSTLDAEVRDLQEGRQAVEERARYELGMVKKNEIFVQISEPSKSLPVASSGANATSAKP